MNAAYLWAQLEIAEQIIQNRLATWEIYHQGFAALEAKHRIERPTIPAECQHNGHMYYIKTKDISERDALIEHLKANDILAVFHYVPLHSSPEGVVAGPFMVRDINTTRESERLVRLPMFYGLSEDDVRHVIATVYGFYKEVDSMKISYVIPCFRSASTIRNVVQQIESTIAKTEYQYEIILVNDCSPDDTLSVLKEIVLNSDNIAVLSFAKNFGQHAALMAGLRRTTGDIVVCLDDDGQTPPNESLKLIQGVLDGADVVYGAYEDKSIHGTEISEPH